jgi:hypothetical protein
MFVGVFTGAASGQLAIMLGLSICSITLSAKLRRRALLSPACWRMGDWALPIHDSGGGVL